MFVVFFKYEIKTRQFKEKRQMKNLNKALLLTMTTGAISLTAAVQADAYGLGDTDFKVTATVLNVRTEPNTTTGVVTKKLKQGDVVRPVELSSDKTWARIGKNQWVSFQYLEMIDNCTIPENGVEYESIETTAYVVTANSLNLRKEPSTASAKIGSFKKGQVVYATKTNGKWLYVEEGHIDGWIHSDYATKFVGESNTATPSFKEETIAMRQLTVTANVLNVRQNPTTDSKVLTKFSKGKQIMTNAQSGNWYKVELDNGFGWLHKDYVTEEIWSMNSNSTWDNIVDMPPAEQEDMSMNSTYDELVDVPAGDEDMTRTVNVPANDVLNVRYSVTLGGSVKDTLANGTKVTLITDYGKASRIKYINSRGHLEFGYVASRYLK